ncbi:isopentenyl-diphosphate delta-isomerase [Sulfurivirga caldicuralii]|uniref:Isopentenyl-diphosphate delta-isomerase n=1 Tax=Sulfurivirga caldicuralii TaxID=364032 RepID=A0A1N6G9P2_9GAMM|nr:type 2 isopentenyl-diphosphate Delta-isomerase [Sulfurivirga caldicuralii]SIO04270.1 isopentenyl-diphosphate delta-isomerase [Sulfurivirga caldicuralii]
MSSLQQRKEDHIRVVLEDTAVDRRQSGLEQIRLMHRALPELDYDAVDPRCTFLDYTLSFPFLISSMTGGQGDALGRINRHLAEAAEAMGVAMAVGSQRIMLAHPEAAESFRLRRYAPSVPLIANLGAVQLNEGITLDDIDRIVDTLEADALYLHLNPLQEVIQPEGDRNFAGLADKIAEVTDYLPIPVILKEVGCGLSPADIELGLQAGVRYFDVAGRGGTSWSRIEAHRSDDDLGITFQDWGLTTLEALQLARPYRERAHLIASGGLRSGVDLYKCVIMGSFMCGVAGPLLQAATESTEAVIQVIERFYREYRTAQFLTGAATFEQAYDNAQLILRA